MTITRRPDPLARPAGPRPVFNPQPARGFTPRANPALENEPTDIGQEDEFESERAAERAQAQLDPGPRRPGGVAHLGPGALPAPRPITVTEAAVAVEAPALMTPPAPIKRPPDAALVVPATPTPAASTIAATSLLTSQEAANILRVTIARMACWRRKGSGPAFIKINRRTITYRAADIEAFLAARLQSGTLA